MISGGGNIGLFLAQRARGRAGRTSTLTLIEADAERARFIADKLTRSVVLHGDARDREIHEEANLRTAQAIVSVTNNDEVNIMAALLAKRYGCEQALTLVNNNVYGGAARLARHRRRDQPARDHGLERAPARPPRPHQVGLLAARRRGRGVRGRGARDLAAGRPAAQGGAAAGRRAGRRDRARRRR